MADLVCIQVAALAGVDLNGPGPGSADAVGVVAGLLITLDHRQRQLRLEVLEGARQQAGLAGARAGDQVECKDALIVQAPAIGRGILVVLAQDIPFDLQHARLTQAGRMRARRTMPVVLIVAVMVIGMMGVGVGVGMVIVPMIVVMRMIGIALDSALALTASADCAHHSTSSSLIRISSPPVTCSWCPPHLGQGSCLAAISTLSAHRMHHAVPGSGRISRRQPSASESRHTRSKLNRIASTSTAASAPISSQTVFTLA